MIDTLFFILQILGVAVIISWALMNDSIADDGQAHGPLAFKSQDKEGQVATARRQDTSRRSLLRRPMVLPRGPRSHSRSTRNFR